MDLELFREMDREELLTYLGFLLREHRVVDAFWFLMVEETYGREAAERLNEDVWERIAPMSVKDLRKYLHLKEKGLAGLEKALKLFPWTSIGGHRITRKGNEVILTAPQCPPQVARVKRNLGEYHCKGMHQRVFASIAREIDSRIHVTCDFAPPDSHPEDLFCRWRFSMSEEGSL